MWEVLVKKYLLPSKLACILRALHQGTNGAVRAHGKASDEFDVSTGVRQGCVLAPGLFNVFIDAVLAATMSA